MVIYTSFPVKRVTARAMVKQVHAFSPAELWRLVADTCAVPVADFFAYLGDLEVAYGIELEDAQPLYPFPLERAGPQSWRYLYRDEPEDAAVLAGAGYLEPDSRH